ncbi:MAG: YtxH domain-containing protein [Acidobacteriaceae bacterium]
MAENDSSSGIGWFLAGLGFGALLGVLYAPKAGRETREGLAASAREAREKAEQLVDQGREQLDTYVDRGKEYADRGRTQWSQYVDRSRGFLHEQQDKVAAAVDAGKQAYQSTTTETHS